MACRWAPVPLRMIVGFGFMAHGYAKLSRGAEAFAGVLQALGTPAPHLMSWVTIVTELAGGAAVFVGAFVTWASIPLTVVMLVAMFTVHLRYGFSSIKLQAITSAGAKFGPPGYECALLYIVCMATLVMGGAGPLAMDGLWRKRLRGESTQRGTHDD
jgi:putative oxidoreductase